MNAAVYQESTRNIGGVSVSTIETDFGRLSVMEPLARNGSTNKAQIYGEISLEYGPEVAHGKVTGLTTTTAAGGGGA